MNKAPSDFPRQHGFSALSGTQPKLSVVEIDGRYYLDQPDEDEIYQRYDVCADLVDQLITYCEKKKQPSYSWEALLNAVAHSLSKKPWGLTADENDWIMKKLKAHFIEA
ncbi:hypothetical protein [Comamonas testosteroni]|uniref:Uncharacterized protein n=1 Tax=Comamonas testosteroni TaxID=285 RepID=A0A096HGD3_COMTE|nr:hypothetical protein [Comamonas testosteroni]KGH27942.1 hypothetical protein P353_16915 [Comamonas testosteroni]